MRLGLTSTAFVGYQAHTRSFDAFFRTSRVRAERPIQRMIMPSTAREPESDSLLELLASLHYSLWPLLVDVEVARRERSRTFKAAKAGRVKLVSHLNEHCALQVYLCVLYAHLSFHLPISRPNCFPFNCLLAFPAFGQVERRIAFRTEGLLISLERLW